MRTLLFSKKMIPKPILIIGILALFLIIGCTKSISDDAPIMKTLEYQENKSATIMETDLLVFMNNNATIRTKAVCIVYFESRFIVCREKI